jgi:hypothetical protein
MEYRYYVKLTYFRKQGKFYGTGSYVSEKEHLFEIWSEVEYMNLHGKLPGLVEGAQFPIISVKVPQHPHKHPHLVVNLEIE